MEYFANGKTRGSEVAAGLAEEGLYFLDIDFALLFVNSRGDHITK